MFELMVSHKVLILKTMRTVTLMEVKDQMEIKNKKNNN